MHHKINIYYLHGIKQWCAICTCGWGMIDPDKAIIEARAGSHDLDDFTEIERAIEALVSESFNGVQ